MGPIQILLADDREDILDGVSAILDDEFEIVGRARDGVELLAASRELSPDVVVTDISMPKMDGLDAARELTRSANGPAIVLLTVHDDPEIVEKALAIGACGYVLKSRAATDLTEAVRRAAAGATFVSPNLILPPGEQPPSEPRT